MNAMDLEDDQETGYDGKKGGKRELSNSKRAAQNRAAQVYLSSWFHSSRFEFVTGGNMASDNARSLQYLLT